LHADAAGLLPWAGQAGDVDQLLHGDAGGQQQCAAGECGQCYVDSWRRKLNTHLL